MGGARSGTTKSTTSHVYDADGNLLIRRGPPGHLDRDGQVLGAALLQRRRHQALPYYEPTGANDPQVMNWANTTGHGGENFFFGLGLPFTNLLDFTSALYTPACVVEGQCLTDRYKAWGKDTA